MNPGEIVNVLTVLGGLGGLGGLIGTIYMLRSRQRESQAVAHRTVAEAEHTTAEANAVMTTVYGAMLDDLREEMDRKVADLERQLGEATGREWVCLENQRTLRDAMVAAGVPVPELRDVFAGVHRTGEHPRRRRSDHIDYPEKE